MTATYEPISTQTLGTATATVTFSSIPATYTDLVLVVNGSASSSAFDAWLRFNGDTTTNYSNTTLTGSGSVANSSRASNASFIFLETQSTFRSTTRTNLIVQIFNYTNTTTFKTLISRASAPGDYVEALIGLWRKTPEAINTILISNSSAYNFSVGSTFTLYGIKAE
jgi:hypothetical protein